MLDVFLCTSIVRNTEEMMLHKPSQIVTWCWYHATVDWTQAVPWNPYTSWQFPMLWGTHRLQSTNNTGKKRGDEFSRLRRHLDLCLTLHLTTWAAAPCMAGHAGRKSAFPSTCSVSLLRFCSFENMTERCPDSFGKDGEGHRALPGILWLWKTLCWCHYTSRDAMRPFCPNFHANLLTTTPTEVTSSVCADTIGKSCENQFLSLFAYENYKKRLQLIFPETISKHKPYLVAWSVSRGNPPGHLPSVTQKASSQKVRTNLH